MDLSKAIELIQQSAVQASGAARKITIHDLSPHIRKGFYGIAAADGSFKIEQAPRGPRGHVLLAISEVEPFCDYAARELGAEPVIWFDGTTLRIVLRDKDVSGTYEDFAMLTLKLTSGFELLQDLDENPRKFSQKDFVRMLRLNFLQALGTKGDQLITACRSLRFSEGTKGHSAVSQGRQSLGRELESEVISELGTIPETVEFVLPIYSDPLLQTPQRILCDLEVNPADQTFLLTPLADEISSAFDRMHQIVRDLCERSGRPVFLGNY